MKNFETKIIKLIELKDENSELINIFKEILEEQDHILIDKSLEQSKDIFFEKYFPSEELEVDFIEIKNFNILKKSIKSNTKIIYFQMSLEKEEELKIIEEIADIAKDISSELKVLVGTE